jgi:hypothetical protein
MTSLPSRAPSSGTAMGDLKWSAAEKVIARNELAPKKRIP